MQQYLRLYAEPETQLLDDLLADSKQQHLWEYTLLIPAYAENADFFHRLAETHCKNNAVLLIVIINQPETSSGENPDNAKLLSTLCDASQPYWQKKNLQLRTLSGTSSALLIIDRFSPALRIPDKQGVGLARKIGADCAATLIAKNRVSRPWIFSTDADTTLTTDYFSTVKTLDNNAQHSAAIIYPFKHRCGNDNIGVATKLYEQSLHHYVNGLSAAGSPYAYHSIGSIIAINSRHYCQVRGFPKKSGGEDFYLLNKLAKTGPIHSLNSAALEIEARTSTRVPFGTGPAVKKILDLANPEEEFTVYNPAVFQQLKYWIDSLPSLQTSSIEQVKLPKAVVEILIEMGVKKALLHAQKHSSTASVFLQHMHIWFDAFRTLKFIHALEKKGFSAVPLSEVSNPGISVN